MSYVFLGYDASELVHPHFPHSLYWGLLLKNCFWQSNLSNHMSACFTGAVGRDPTCAVLCSSPWQMLPSFCLPFKNLGKFCFKESNNKAVSVSRCDGSSFLCKVLKKTHFSFCTVWCTLKCYWSLRAPLSKWQTALTSLLQITAKSSYLFSEAECSSFC